MVNDRILDPLLTGFNFSAYRAQPPPPYVLREGVHQLQTQDNALVPACNCLSRLRIFAKRIISALNNLIQPSDYLHLKLLPFLSFDV